MTKRELRIHNLRDGNDHRPPRMTTKTTTTKKMFMGLLLLAAFSIISPYRKNVLTSQLLGSDCSTLGTALLFWKQQQQQQQPPQIEHTMPTTLNLSISSPTPPQPSVLLPLPLKLLRTKQRKFLSSEQQVLSTHHRGSSISWQHETANGGGCASVDRNTNSNTTSSCRRIWHVTHKMGVSVSKSILDSYYASNEGIDKKDKVVLARPDAVNNNRLSSGGQKQLRQPDKMKLGANSGDSREVLLLRNIYSSLISGEYSES